MKLIKRRNDTYEYHCELTETLDYISGIDKYEIKLYRHYILADSGMVQDKCLSIRVPGRTIGDIVIDDNNIIIEIGIGADVIKSYPDNINDIIKQFIGQKIKF